MLDSSRLVKLFLPLLLGDMSTGRSEVNKHISRYVHIRIHFPYAHILYILWYSREISMAPIYEDFEAFIGIKFDPWPVKVHARAPSKILSSNCLILRTVIITCCLSLAVRVFITCCMCGHLSSLTNKHNVWLIAWSCELTECDCWITWCH